MIFDMRRLQWNVFHWCDVFSFFMVAAVLCMGHIIGHSIQWYLRQMGRFPRLPATVGLWNLKPGLIINPVLINS